MGLHAYVRLAVRVASTQRCFSYRVMPVVRTLHYKSTLTLACSSFLISSPSLLQLSSSLPKDLDSADSSDDEDSASPIVSQKSTIRLEVS